MNTRILTVDRLGKTYGPVGAATSKEAIRELTLEALDRELVCIVGPSGAGKTTLLRCLAGLMPPTTGQVLFRGRSLREASGEIAVVFQDYSRSLFPWLTSAKNIELPLRSKGVPKTERRQRVAEALQAVGLPDVGTRHPWQLSGGMQQRVAIARALAYAPKLLLMDEPFASVDAQTRFELEDLILEVRHRYEMTIVFVTHDIDEAVYIGDRVVVLSQSPAVVKQELVVDLPQPRDQIETRSDPEFARLRGEILKLVTNHP